MAGSHSHGIIPTAARLNNGIGLIVEVDFLAWQRHDGTLLDAAHTLGDSDGDGDVDADDLAAFSLAFGPLPVFIGIVAVPEPGMLRYGWAAGGRPVDWVLAVADSSAAGALKLSC